MKAFFSIPATVLLFILMTSSACFAHRVNVFAWVDGDTVRVESKFGGGKKVQNGTVTVKSAQGAAIATGTTSETGEFSFPSPNPPQDLTVIVNAGIGHQGEWTLRAAEFTPVSAAETVAPADKGFPAKQPVKAPISEMEARPRPEPIPAGPAAGDARLKQLLRDELSPIKHDLAALRERPGDFRDIVGGIGYIIGIFGLIAYWKSRSPKGGAS